MGRYSRKHMIEFASFAKSYQSSRNVETAYEAYLKGDRVLNKYSIYSRIKQSNVVYLDGLTIKNRYGVEDHPNFMFDKYDMNKYEIESWDEINKILNLKSK